MAVSNKHTFQSAKSDGTDATLLQPSYWNAEHTVTCAGNSLLGNATGGNTAIAEVPCTAQGRSILAAATIADLIAAGFTIPSTGDIKATIKTVADTGWVMLNDGTIGNDTSGATLASTANAAALYSLVWTNITNTWAAIQDSTGSATTRGGSAAADFAASKRLPLPKALGRVLGAAGAGSGLTSRALGEKQGEETHLLTIAEMPSHDHGGGITVSSGQFGGSSSNFTYIGLGGGSTAGFVKSTSPDVIGTGSIQNGTSFSAAGAISGQGGNTAHNVMQPTTFVNWMIKL